MIKRIGAIFPGQGSQKVGMCRDIFDAYPETHFIFDCANAIYETDLTSIMFEGPSEKLTLTEYAQPAIFLASVAILEVLRQNGLQIDMVAGHSLGEITAYYVAGVFDLDFALRFIKVRSESMKQAIPEGMSGMAAIMGLPEDQIATIISKYSDAPLVISNYNSVGQIVISGEKKALESACVDFKKNGGRAIIFPVSAAFHSPLMQDAFIKINAYLENNNIESAEVPIVLNRTAKGVTDKVELKTNLAHQVTSPVRWTESVRYLSTHVDSLIEIGPGRVLTGLVNKTLPEYPVFNISTRDQLLKFLMKLGEYGE